MNTKSGFAPILIVAILGLVVVVGYFALKPAVSTSQPTSTLTFPEGPTENWKVVKDSENGIEFKYPNDWVLDQVEGFSFPLFLKDKPERQFYVIEIRLVENRTIDKDVEMDATINSSNKSTKESRNITIAGEDAIQVTGKFKEHELISGSYVVTFIQHGNNVVKVTLNYDSFLNTYNQILSTFKFTD